MDRKQVLIIGVVVLLCAIALVAFFMGRNSGNGPVAANPTPSSSSTNNGGASPTWAPPPPGEKVPEKGDTGVAGNVAVPQFTYGGFRTFAISIDNNKFVPDTIVAHKGDIIHANFSAVDQDYDFVQPDFGLKATIRKGETHLIEFGATATGKFTFYCSRCGGPDKGPVGYIEIVSP